MLVNLGLVHREGSVVRYWDDWLTWMPRQGWRFFGWYVWDQGVTVPGDWAGRLAPRHEFLFHFNREAGSRTRRCRASSPARSCTCAVMAPPTTGCVTRTAALASGRTSISPRRHSGFPTRS
jgi:hypothetical protein